MWKWLLDLLSLMIPTGTIPPDPFDRPAPRYDPRWEPDEDARYDRGDGKCFHCRGTLTDEDKGPDGKTQICNRCLTKLETVQREHFEALTQFRM